MKFEIHDLGTSMGIVHIHIEQNKLSWDFPLGSSYDLCAIFNRQNGKTLRELQAAGVRPYLFHKRLKTCCKFLPEVYREGFLLFPARFNEDGVLDIADQIYGQNAQLLTDSKTVYIHTVFFKKKFFKEFLKSADTYAFTEHKISNITDDGTVFIYYKISRSEDLDSTIYKLPVTSDNVNIIINPGEKIIFFKDASCKEVVYSEV